MNIALIDDHVMFSKSLAQVLAQYDFIEEVRTYKSAKEYQLLSSLVEPDVLIIDIIMPGVNGIELLAQFKAQNKKIKIILLSGIKEVQTIRHAMRMGADGYMSKESPPQELVEAIQAVYNGESVIDKSLHKAIVKSTFTEEQMVYHLSPREKDVLAGICSGKTIKEIAREKKLSVHTVQSYHKNIMKKFKMTRTSDLIIYAIQNGLYYSHDESHK